MKPKQLEQAAAKLKLLNYLQRRQGVDREVVAAAKAKVGADLADALSGELSEALLAQFEADVTRLEKREYQAGDAVVLALSPSLHHKTHVKTVDGQNVAVDYEGRNYTAGKGQVAPTDLDDLIELRDACRTALGKAEPAPLGMTFPWMFRGEPEQYPTIDLPED